VFERRMEKLIHLLTIHLSFHLNPNLVFIWSISYSPPPPLKINFIFHLFFDASSSRERERESGGEKIENFDDKEGLRDINVFSFHSGGKRDRTRN
jgi:hypothetical protein